MREDDDEKVYRACSLLSRSMTKNADEETICSRMVRLVTDYEQARDTDSTEIGRQFAVSTST